MNSFFPNSLCRDKLQKYVYNICTILNLHPAVIYQFHISKRVHISCRVSHVRQLVIGCSGVSP